MDVDLAALVYLALLDVSDDLVHVDMKALLDLLDVTDNLGSVALSDN